MSAVLAALAIGASDRVCATLAKGGAHDGLIDDNGIDFVAG